MSTTVTFNGTSLQNVNKVVRTAKHDSAPDREMEILPLARSDGGVFVSEHYQSKVITISGIIKASSQANLEAEIDSFKELLSRKNKNLDISYAGGTRRYVAYSRSVIIDRDFFHKNFAPYDVEFVVPGSVGKDTATTEALDSISADPTYTGSVVFSGSAEPRPLITLTFGSGWTSAYGIQFKNTDTDEECIITRSTIFADGDILEIDCDNKKVELNDDEIEFYRVFPSFAIGTNNIEVTAGDIIDQQFDHGSKSFTSLSATYNEANGTDYPAQSFTVPHTDATYQGISLFLRKPIAGVADGVVEIQTDSGGNPSGTPVSNGTFVITIGNVTSSSDIGGGAWLTVNSTNKFTLSANTVYWIVLKISADATTSTIIWDRIQGSEATYGRGYASFSTDGGANWIAIPTADRPFKLLFGGKADSPAGTLTLDVDYTKRYL